MKISKEAFSVNLLHGSVVDGIERIHAVSLSRRIVQKGLSQAAESERVGIASTRLQNAHGKPSSNDPESGPLVPEHVMVTVVDPNDIRTA